MGLFSPTHQNIFPDNILSLSATITFWHFTVKSSKVKITKLHKAAQIATNRWLFLATWTIFFTDTNFCILVIFGILER